MAGRSNGSGRVAYAGRALLAFLFLIAPFFLHFQRNHLPGRLTESGYETVQAARYLATRGKFQTQVVRPLELRYVRSTPDAAIPDLRHAPLHLALIGMVLKVLHETRPGDGDRGAVLLHLFLTLFAGVGTAWVARAIFPEWHRASHFLRAGALFAFGGAAMSLALEPEPAVLAALFAPMLLLAVNRLDGETRVARSVGWAAAAGLGWGLMFLSLYSTLAFLPILGLYVALTSRHRVPATLAFFAVALALLAPVPLRAMRATGNPMFHPRLLELVMYTSTYPDDTLYHLTSMPRSIPAYLADGGAREVARKLGKGVFEYLPASSSVIGPFLSILFLGAGLVRFTDPRLNRLRALGYGLFAAHLLGLALFFPAEQGASALFVHVPLAAILGAGFLEIVVRSRRLPKFQTGVALFAWTAVACVPGLARYWTGEDYSAPAVAMFDWLAVGDPQMRDYELKPSGVFGSDIPAEVAFRHGAPSVYLPADSLEVDQVQKYLGQDFKAFFISPQLAKNPAQEQTLQWWRETQSKIVGYWGILGNMPAIQRGEFSRQYQLTYPAALSDTLSEYRPMPIAEGNTGSYSLVFWYNTSRK